MRQFVLRGDFFLSGYGSSTPKDTWDEAGRLGAPVWVPSFGCRQIESGNLG